MELYYYNAFVKKVYDGDTITVDIDLGFNTILKNQKIRLYGINAPEVRGDSRKEGLETRDWLRTRILHKNIILRSRKHKKGKYGRWLGTVFTSLNMSSINEELVAKGLAIKANY